MSNYSDSSFGENSANTSWYKAFHLIPKNSKVLDVGCSSGNFGIELINRKSCIVDGIEIDDSDYKKAKAKLRNVYQLNVETDKLDVLKEKYDIIYFGDVIEHLINPSAALRKIQGKLTPSGKILFSIPNMSHIAVRLLLLKGDFEYTETGLLDKTHIHFYSLDEVYRVFQEAGYEVDHIDFVQKDYPKPLIRQWLKGIGMTANENFYKEMSKPEASAFQFVGTAKVATKNKPVKRQQFGPIDLFDSFHTNTVNDLNLEIKRLVDDNNRLKASLRALELKWEKLKKNPIRFVAGSVKRKVNPKK